MYNRSSLLIPDFQRWTNQHDMYRRKGMAVRVGLEEWAEPEKPADNPQEAVIIRLLQEGLLPEEIANLKSVHIDSEARLVYVQRKGGLRPHPVSKMCMQLLQQADRQAEYSVTLSGSEGGGVKLLQSEYVIKVSLLDYVGTEAFIHDPASVRLRAVYNRLRKLSDAGSYAIALESGSIDLVS
jgi:integrase